VRHTLSKTPQAGKCEKLANFLQKRARMRGSNEIFHAAWFQLNSSAPIGFHKLRALVFLRIGFLQAEIIPG